jgi:HAD superfamily phosphatase
MSLSEGNAIAAIAIFDIDGVVRDVSGSYRRALADTVESFTQGAYRPSVTDIDVLKGEGLWNNDWEASRELIYRYFEGQGQARCTLNLDYQAIITFFQNRYRGPDPNHWTGYICYEPLLMSANYLEHLTQADILWGFFSGATRGSASYVLEKRLGLQAPALIAMEDAPGKPDPTGLIAVVEHLERSVQAMWLAPVVYVGDTVADMQTVQNARTQYPDRTWIGVGVLPPHVQVSVEYANSYAQQLQQAGGQQVFSHVEQLTAIEIQTLVSSDRLR